LRQRFADNAIAGQHVDIVAEGHARICVMDKLGGFIARAPCVPVAAAL
jgi:hypothetical protein